MDYKDQYSLNYIRIFLDTDMVGILTIDIPPREKLNAVFVFGNFTLWFVSTFSKLMPKSAAY